VKRESSKLFRRVDLFLYSKTDPQKEFTAGIQRNPPSTIQWTYFCSGSRNGGRGRVAVRFPSVLCFMAVPEALVLVCNTHGPAPWVSCMTARGEEEAGGKRESAMCSQTLRGAGREGQSEGAGMKTAPAGCAARSRPSRSNLLHLRRKPPPRPGRWKRSASNPRGKSCAALLHLRRKPPPRPDRWKRSARK
jgi:hypothetical protein